MPVGLAFRILPDIPEQIQHHRRAVEPGAARGEAAENPQLLFELRGLAGVDGVVAGIVGTRRHFVDEEPSVAGEEKLHREQSAIVEGLGHAQGDGADLVEETRLETGGHDGDVEDVVAVEILGRIVGKGAARSVAHHEHGQFGGEVDALLEHGTRGGEGGPDRLGIARAGHGKLTLAVIAELGGLEDATVLRQRGEGGAELLRVLDHGEARAGNAVLLEETLFPLAMLADRNRLGAGHEGDLCGDRLEEGTGDVLELDRGDLGPLEEGGEPGGRVEGLLDDMVGHSGGSGVGAADPGDDAIAHAAGGQGEHATELAATENADGRSGGEGRGRTHSALSKGGNSAASTLDRSPSR
jgi:hypothetical protein